MDKTKNVDSYVQSYKESHSKPIDFDYTLGYIHYVIIDNLISDYNLLDIGCGTAGYRKLIKNDKSYTGIDYSPKMIDVARGFNPQDKFIISDFHSFNTGEKYDAIVDTISGIYYPHTIDNTNKIKSLLTDGGIAVMVVKNMMAIKERIGNIVKNRKQITEKELVKMIGMNKFFSFNIDNKKFNVTFLFFQSLK